jgi:hypothetical protein
MKSTAFLLLSCGMFASELEAKLPPITLDQLVGFSEIIFVGRVHARGDAPVLRGSFNSWGRLEIDVERTICGKFFKDEWPNGRVEALYFLNPVERPSFDPGVRYLFFFRESYSGPQLAPSYHGAVRIEGDLVHMEPVDDVGRALPLTELETMIDCRKATGDKELY